MFISFDIDIIFWTFCSILKWQTRLIWSTLTLLMTSSRLNLEPCFGFRRYCLWVPLQSMVPVKANPRPNWSLTWPKSCSYHFRCRIPTGPNEVKFMEFKPFSLQHWTALSWVTYRLWEFFIGSGWVPVPRQRGRVQAFAFCHLGFRTKI